MPAFNDTIARKHTCTIWFETGESFEIITQSGLFDLEDMTFEHTTLPGGVSGQPGFTMNLPSGRHKINDVTLTMLETGGTRDAWATFQLNRRTTSFQYAVYDYEGIERDFGTAHGVRVIQSKLDDTDRNADGAVTVTVKLTVMEWTKP